MLYKPFKYLGGYCMFFSTIFYLIFLYNLSKKNFKIEIAKVKTNSYITNDSTSKNKIKKKLGTKFQDYKPSFVDQYFGLMINKCVSYASSKFKNDSCGDPIYISHLTKKMFR